MTQLQSLRMCDGVDADGTNAFDGSHLFVPCNNHIQQVNVDVTHRSMSLGWVGPNVGAAGSPVLAGGSLWSIDASSGTLYALDPGDGRGAYLGVDRFGRALRRAGHRARARDRPDPARASPRSPARRVSHPTRPTRAAPRRRISGIGSPGPTATCSRSGVRRVAVPWPGYRSRSRSSAWPAGRPRVTGSSRATAASSRSAPRTSTARWAATT